MPDNVVGTAYVIVRALTQGVRDEIKKGFDKGAKDAQKDVDKTGEKVGERFADKIGEGFQKSGFADKVRKQARDAGKVSNQELARSHAEALRLDAAFNRNRRRSNEIFARARERAARDSAIAEIKSTIRVSTAYERETKKITKVFDQMRQRNKQTLKEVSENIVNSVQEGIDRASFAARGGGKDIGRRIGRAIGNELAFEIRRFPILPFVLAAFAPVIAGAAKILAAYVGELVALLAPVGPAIGAGLLVAASGLTALGQGVGAFIAAIKTKGPALTEFKDRMKELREEFRDVGRAIQDVTLDKFAASAERAANNLLPRFSSELTQTGRVLATVSERFAALSGDPFFQARFGTILASNNRTLTSLGGAAVSLTDAFVTLLAAASPLTEQFSAYVADVTAGWAASLRLAQASGELSAWFQRQGEFLQQLGRIAGNVRTTLGNLFEVAIGDAESLWSRIEGLTERWRDFTNSVSGRNQIAEYFDQSRAVVMEVNGLFGDMFRLLGQGLSSNSDTLLEFVRALRNQVLPSIADMAAAFAGLGPAFIQLAVTTADFFATLAQLGVLQTFVTTLSNAFTVISSLLSLPVAGDVLQWSLAFIAFGKALNVVTLGAFTRALTPMLGRLGEFGTALGIVGRQALAAAGGAGIGALRGSIGLLAGALGGPVGIAITAVTVALGFLVKKHLDAKQAAAEQEAKLLELSGTLDKATGSVTAQTAEWVASEAEANGLLDVTDRLGLSNNKLAQAALGDADAQAQLRSAVEGSNAALASSVDLTDANRAAQAAANDVTFQAQGMSSNLSDELKNLNFTQKDFQAAIAAGGEELEGFLAKLLAVGAISPETANKIRETANGNKELMDFTNQVNEALDAEQQRLRDVASAADTTSEGVRTLADAIGVLADEFATVEDKARALDDALRVLSGGQLDVDKTARDMHSTFREVEDALVNTARSAEAGKTVYFDLSRAIDQSTGKLDQTTEVGAKVADTYDKMFKAASDSALAIAQSGGSAQEVQAPFNAMTKEFEGLLKAAGATPAEIDAITNSLQTVPLETIVDLILEEDVVDKVGAAEQRLAEVNGTQAIAKLVGNDVDLAKKIFDARGDLDALDAIIATATADLDASDARKVSRDIFAILGDLDAENPTPKADLDPRVLNRVKTNIDKQLTELGNRKPTPEVRAEISKWKAKRDQVEQQIRDLNSRKPTPKVDADERRYRAKALAVERSLSNLNNRQASPTIRANDQASGTIGSIRAALAALPAFKQIQIRAVRTGVRIQAQGGIVGPGGRTVTAANGRIIKAANGMFAERQAMIAGGGSNILWAEPETENESYIPWARSKRTRATRILDHTAREFGYKLDPMADGGIVARASAVLAQSSSGTQAGRLPEAAPQFNITVDGPEVQYRAEEIARRTMIEYRREQAVRGRIPRG